MPRAKKPTTKYYIHNDSCDNFHGPFDTLERAKAEAKESLNEFGAADEDNEVQVLALVGTITPPQNVDGIWKEA